MSDNQNIDADTEAPATPAATMVIMRRDRGDAGPQLLMVERSAALAFAGGAAVFPGGKVDRADTDFAAMLAPSVTLGLPLDEVAARLAAIRETLEETGLALALQGADDQADCHAAARGALHGGAALAEICAAYGWSPDLRKLVPWARWRPPSFERVSRVFDTRFYLIDAGEGTLSAVVDATENTRLFWATAHDVLSLADDGKVKIIFPTRRNLERLALFDSYAAAAVHAAAHPVETILTYIDRRADGNYLCIPNGHGYPVTEEPLTKAQRG